MKTTPGTLTIARRLARESGTLAVEGRSVVVRWEAGGRSEYAAQTVADALALAHELGRVDAHRRAHVA